MWERQVLFLRGKEPSRKGKRGTRAGERLNRDETQGNEIEDSEQGQQQQYTNTNTPTRPTSIFKAKAPADDELMRGSAGYRAGTAGAAAFDPSLPPPSYK